MLPNNFSSQYYACQERAESFKTRVDEDGVPDGARSYQPGRHLLLFRWLFQFLISIGKALVSLVLLPVKIASALMKPIHLPHAHIHR